MASPGLCIIAGSGALPLQVAASARAQGRSVFIAALKGFARPEDFQDYDLEVFGIAQLGALTRAMKARAMTEACLIGGVVRPALADIKPDLALLKHLPSLASAFGKGDDGLLSGVVRILEAEGLVIRSVQDIAPEIVGTGRVAHGRRHPDEESRAAIDIGMRVLAALSPFDIGQAAVIVDGRPVAVEGAEGTDAMLARVVAMREQGRLPAGSGGVLVKAPKSGQDMRVDVPTIGPTTIRGANAAGLRGIAIPSGKVLIAQHDATIALADELGLFIEVLS